VRQVGRICRELGENPRGYSLPEVLAAVALVGLVTTFGVYSVNSASWRSAASCREVVSQLELSRSRAVLRQNNFVVSFDSANQQYAVLDDVNNDGVLTAGIGETRTIHELSATGADMVFGFVNGINGIDGNPISDAVSFASDNVTFTPLGTAETGVIYMITSQGQENDDPTHMRAISVNTATARIRRWRYDQNSNGPGPWKLEQ